MMKKPISMLIVALMMLCTPVSALAHGHCANANNNANSNANVRLCGVRSCTKSSNHRHNGRTYRPHHSRDGHSYHRSGRHR